MYVDRERARERDKLHKKCVSGREGETKTGRKGEKRMSWHRIFAYEPERARAALPLALLTGG